MQCHEFEQRLNDVLDERGDPSLEPQLLAHAQNCEPCRQLFAGQRVLLSGLRHCTAPSLPADFSRRVVMVAAIPAPLARPRSSSKILLAAGVLLASAAAALLAVSLVWYARSREPAMAEAPTAARGAGAESNAPPRAPWRGFAGGTLAMSESDVIFQIRDGFDELADTVERYGEVERLAPGIRPLRLSFALLWDTLFRALPSVHDDSRPSPPKAGTSSLFVDQLRLA
jgi:hypothetical protein